MTPKFKFQLGEKISFLVNGKPVEDIITGRFTAEALVQPYGSNQIFPAYMLQNHSWIAEKDILPIEICEECGGTGWRERAWDSAPVACVFCDGPRS